MLYVPTLILRKIIIYYRTEIQHINSKFYSNICYQGLLYPVPYINSKIRVAFFYIAIKFKIYLQIFYHFSLFNQLLLNLFI